MVKLLLLICFYIILEQVYAHKGNPKCSNLCSLNSTDDLIGKALDPVLWVQTSVEYKMMARQVYKLAEMNIDTALKDKNWTAAFEQGRNYQNLPPAVILDLDETVMDNSPFEARCAKVGVEYDFDLFSKWVNEANADIIPGAKSFISKLKHKNIKVFYVSNRVASFKKATLKNLREKLDKNITADDILLKAERKNWTSAKKNRRRFIAKNYRIIMLVGDDYNDFVYLGKVSPYKRKSQEEIHSKYWGKKWFLLSNPLYGNWKKSLKNYKYNYSDRDKLNLKYRNLNLKTLKKYR